MGFQINHQTVNKYKLSNSYTAHKFKNDNQFIAQVCAFANEIINTQQQMFSFQTSGTTGKPKNIEFTKKQLFASAKQTLTFFDLKPGNSVLLALPMQYVAAKMMVTRAIVGKLNLITSKPVLNPLLQLNDKTKLHFAAFTPVQVSNILNNITTKTIFDAIDTVIIGGASVPENLRHKLKEQKNAVFETYGTTETLSHVAAKKISGKNNSIFTAISNAVFFSIGEKSNLFIHAKHIGNLPIKTNDVVDLKNRKQFVWKGRLDNVINSGGIKLNPEEMEQILLRKFNSLPPFYITSIKDNTFGESPVFVTEKRLDIGILQKINNFLHPHQKIKKFIYDTIEKNDNDKTIRKRF